MTNTPARLAAALLVLGFAAASSQTRKGSAPRPAGADIIFYSVRALDARNVFAVGKPGIIAHTTDGGKTWEILAHPEQTGADFYGVDFTDGMHGVIVGEKGTILRTADC